MFSPEMYQLLRLLSKMTNKTCYAYCLNRPSFSFSSVFINLNLSDCRFASGLSFSFVRNYISISSPAARHFGKLCAFLKALVDRALFD